MACRTERYQDPAHGPDRDEPLCSQTAFPAAQPGLAGLRKSIRAARSHTSPSAGHDFGAIREFRKDKVDFPLPPTPPTKGGKSWGRVDTTLAFRFLFLMFLNGSG